LVNFLKDIGPFVGITAFIAFAVLLYLYIQRARELHQIRKTAPFLAEGETNNGQPDEEESRSAAVRARRGRTGAS